MFKRYTSFKRHIFLSHGPRHVARILYPVWFVYLWCVHIRQDYDVLEHLTWLASTTSVWLVVRIRNAQNGICTVVFPIAAFVRYCEYGICIQIIVCQE